MVPSFGEAAPAFWSRWIRICCNASRSAWMGDMFLGRSRCREMFFSRT
ncbi:MAG: hypothetical protein MZV64_59805 [Ignavibacteriales bacterium]|nr:hypothetical protein [Ignavibacteriales bacterium]